jgi:AcrR family transcriptional regulator
VSTESEILAAARELFARKGEQAVTMRAVAERVGVTATAIYRHYRDKAALLERMAQTGFETLGERCRKVRETTKDPVLQLRRVLAECIRFSLEQPETAGSMFRARRKKARRFPADFRKDPGPVFGLAMQLVSAGMEAGRLRRDDVLETTFHLWAHVQGLMSLHRAGRVGSEADFRRVAVRSLDRLVDGLEA